MIFAQDSCQTSLTFARSPSIVHPDITLNCRFKAHRKPKKRRAKRRKKFNNLQEAITSKKGKKRSLMLCYVLQEGKKKLGRTGEDETVRLMILYCFSVKRHFSQPLNCHSELWRSEGMLARRVAKRKFNKLFNCRFRRDQEVFPFWVSCPGQLHDPTIIFLSGSSFMRSNRKANFVRWHGRILRLVSLGKEKQARHVIIGESSEGES